MSVHPHARLPPSTNVSDEVQKAQHSLRSILQRSAGALEDDTLENSHLPVIDVGPSFSSKLEDRLRVAQQVRSACVDIGFFYIVNHGVSVDSIRDGLNLGKRFFHELSAEKKGLLHVKHSPMFRGWKPSEYATYMAGPGGSPMPDRVLEHKEAFNWGYQDSLDPLGGDGKYVELDGSQNMHNVWPDESDLPGFNTGIRKIYGQLLQLSRHLLGVIAMSLNLSQDHFDSFTTHPGGIARLLYYPAFDPAVDAAGPDHVGIRPHTDFELFTLLLQSPECSGLQVLASDESSWITVEPIPGGIVVNIGDLLMRLTAGLYKSTVHRATNKSLTNRYSMAFFFSTNYDEPIQVISDRQSASQICHHDPEKAKLANDPSQVPRPEMITAGQYIIQRLALANKANE